MFIEHPLPVCQPRDSWSSALHDASCPLLCVQFRLRLNSGELESSQGRLSPLGGEDTGREGRPSAAAMPPSCGQRPREEAGGVWGAVLTGGTGWGLVSSVHFTCLINSSCWTHASQALEGCRETLLMVIQVLALKNERREHWDLAFPLSTGIWVLSWGQVVQAGAGS